MRGLVSVFERYGDRIPPIAIVAVVTVILALSIACSRGGYAHPELEQYIPHYLSQQTLLQKVFDFKKVEIVPVYRPRPLSYLVDDLDVAFIAWSCRHGFPHFLSLSYYLFWILDCLLLWVFFVHYLRLNRLTSGLLICLLSTDPVMFFQSSYFRSAKPGGTALLLAAFVVLLQSSRASRDKRAGLRRTSLLCSAGLLLFCSCLFDEIPVAYATAAALMLLMEAITTRKFALAPAPKNALLVIVSVLSLFAWYDLVLHPRLIWAITGEKASLLYQTGTLASLFWNPAAALAGSISVFFDTFGHLTGNVPQLIAVILILAVISIWAATPNPNQMFEQVAPSGRSHARNLPMRRVLTGAMLMIVCLYGMISRHHAVMRIGVRQSSYVLPLTMVFVLFLGLTISVLGKRKFLSRGKIQLALFVLVSSNLTFVLTQRVFGYGDPFSQVLLATLNHRPFLFVESPGGPTLPRLEHDVLRSPIYRALNQVTVDSHR